MASGFIAGLVIGAVTALTAAATEPRVIESGERVDREEVVRLLGAEPADASATLTRSIRKATDAADEPAAAIALGIEFAFDSAVLPTAATRQLDAIADAVRQLTGTPLILIEGHTDSSGPEDYNATLSRRRAEAVRDYLVARGVPASRLEVSGAGEAQPLVPDDPVDARNRRVQFRRVDGG